MDMFKNLTVAWTVAVIAVVIAAGALMSARSADQRAAKAQAKLDAIASLKTAYENTEPGRFISVDVARQEITYGVPHQVERNGSIFVDYIPQTATYDSGVLMIRSSVPGFDISRLSELKSGQDISVRTGTTETGQQSIEELIIP